MNRALHCLDRVAVALLAAALGACTGAGSDGGGQQGDGDGSSDAATEASTTTNPDTGTTTDDTTDTDGTTTDTTTDTADTTDTGSVGCTIALPGDDFYPAGTAAADDGTLYVGSLGTGAVVHLRPCETEAEALIPAGSELRNTVGLLVAADLLIACDSDLSFLSPPAIDVFDRSTGARIASHGFATIGFCNALTQDDAGNIYASDSSNARIVRVRAEDLAVDGVDVETWVSDPMFTTGMGELGLDGLAFDGASTIYAVHNQQGALYAVTIDGNHDAGAIALIQLDSPLVRPDGLGWIGGSSLLLIEGGLGVLSRATLRGSAGVHVVVADGLDTPTSFAGIDGLAWIAQGQLDHLSGKDPSPPTLPFTVVAAAYEP